MKSRLWSRLWPRPAVAVLALAVLAAVAGCSAYRRAPLSWPAAGDPAAMSSLGLRVGDRVRLELVGGGRLKGRVREVRAEALVVRGSRLELAHLRVDDEAPRPPATDHTVALADIRTLEVYDREKALAGLLGAVAGAGIAVCSFLLLVFSSGPGLN